MPAKFDDLIHRLAQGDLVSCIHELQVWLPTATPADLNRLITGWPEPARPKIVTLLRDLLTGYPTVRLGAVVMLEWRSPGRDQTWLPVTDEPSACGHRLAGWLAPDEPVLTRAPRGRLRVITNKITVAVAVLEATEGREVVDADELGDRWWCNLFRRSRVGDSVYMSARMVLPLPDALEAARVTRDTAIKRAGADGPRWFLGDTETLFAQDAGQQFAADCAARAVA